MIDHHPIILHLESATKVCSVAISQGDTLLDVQETHEGNKHSEWMTRFVDMLMKKADIQYSDLDAISVSQGPGSYTGLRVAYSVAKGMAYSLNIPMIGVDTLRSLGLGYFQQNPSNTSSSIVLPMIDARRMEVYMMALDQNLDTITPVQAMILDEHSLDAYASYDRIIAVGDGAFKLEQIEWSDTIKAKMTVHTDIICSAGHLHTEAIQKMKDQDFLDVAYDVPHYLKSPNITRSKKKLLTN